MPPMQRLFSASAASTIIIVRAMVGGKAKLCFLAIMDARTLVRTNTLSMADETLRSIPSVLSTKQFHKLIYQTGVIKDVYFI